VTTLAERALRYDSEHARSLRALAYRMLGSRAEAEDIVQEAWLRWAQVDETTVQHAGAYLSRLVTNLCLDKLGSAAAKREQYVGVWLPEPLLNEEAGWSPGPEVQAEFAQDVSVAFMLALERLLPLERAAFLLHDVFDLDFDEIGQRLERSPAACRQLASRARNHVKADYARREVEEEERERLFGAFSEAVRNFDVDALAKVLTEDAVMLADGGGKVSAVPRPLRGGAPDRQDLHRLRQAADKPRLAPGVGAHQRPAGLSDLRRRDRPAGADHHAGALGHRAGPHRRALRPAQSRQATGLASRAGPQRRRRRVEATHRRQRRAVIGVAAHEGDPKLLRWAGHRAATNDHAAGQYGVS
jgi:RNA polymerase sigma-70 factor, ECF subfamily